SFKDNRLTGDLGPADRLAVTYKGAAPAGGPVNVLSADGLVTVRVEPRGVSADARLTLQALAGQTAQWRLLLPARAEVKVDPSGTARVAKIDKVPQKNLLLVSIHLKEPSADPLTVQVHVPVPLRTGQRLAVGPFAVPGAARQAGSVLVSNAA